MNLTTNPYAQGHNLDASDHLVPLEFETYQQVVDHLENCGYWINPISLPQDQYEIFDQHWVATDWSTSGYIHFKRR